MTITSFHLFSIFTTAWAMTMPKYNWFFHNDTLF